MARFFSLCALAIAILFKNVFSVNTVVQNNSFFYYNVIVQLPCFLLGMIMQIENTWGKSGAPVFWGVCAFVIAIVCFFCNITEYRYILAVTAMGYSTYFLSFIIQKIHHCNWLEAFGRKSYYIFLVHPFFVWTVPVLLEKLFDIQGIVLYVLLLPVMFTGSYYGAVVLEAILCKIQSKIKISYHVNNWHLKK